MKGDIIVSAWNILIAALIGCLCGIVNSAICRRLVSKIENKLESEIRDLKYKNQQLQTMNTIQQEEPDRWKRSYEQYESEQRVREEYAVKRDATWLHF